MGQIPRLRPRPPRLVSPLGPHRLLLALGLPLNTLEIALTFIYVIGGLATAATWEEHYNDSQESLAAGIFWPLVILIAALLGIRKLIYRAIQAARVEP